MHKCPLHLALVLENVVEWLYLKLLMSHFLWVTRMTNYWQIFPPNLHWSISGSFYLAGVFLRPSVCEPWPHVQGTRWLSLFPFDWELKWGLEPAGWGCCNIKLELENIQIPPFPQIPCYAVGQPQCVIGCGHLMAEIGAERELQNAKRNLI